MHSDKQLICVTGLPRAGSTLLCQLLAHHPDIHSPGHSSPLVNSLNAIRSNTSNDVFFRAQLDIDYDGAYQRLSDGLQGFFNGWFNGVSEAAVVDKNRDWMNQLDLAEQLSDDVRMLVCVREPGQIFGSIEARHQQSVLLDFTDRLAHLTPYQRGDKLFAKDGVIGGPVNAIANLQDLTEQQQQKFFFVVFEQLMSEPQQVMQDIFNWLGRKPHTIDMQALDVRPHESDSHYNFKYRHNTRPAISAPKPHQIPARIEQEIKDNFSWFYQNFYPGMLEQPAGKK